MTAAKITATPKVPTKKKPPNLVLQGRGGNINITTHGIYGLIFTNQLQPTRSEINASSQFGVSGTVQVNTLTVDPSQGLANLPEQVIDISKNSQSLLQAGFESSKPV